MIQKINEINHQIKLLEEEKRKIQDGCVHENLEIITEKEYNYSSTCDTYYCKDCSKDLGEMFVFTKWIELL